MDTEIIKAIVDENPLYTVREFADILKIPQTTVHNNTYEDRLRQSL